MISNAEAITNFENLTIGAETLETDFYLQGSYSVSAQASNKAGELYCEVVGEFGRALDFDTGGADEGQLLFMWIGCTTLGIIESVANRGLAIRLFTDASNWADFTIAGYDDLRNFRAKKGGFVCFALDPTLPPTYENGTFDYGNIIYVGIHIETTASAKTQNIMIDTILVGFGIKVSGTDTDGWSDMADYCTAYATRAWGMIQYDESKAMIYSMGKIQIGKTDQTANTSLTDSDKIIKFLTKEYYYNSAWVPMVKDDYLGIDVVDASGYTTTWQDGILVGTENGRSGSRIEGNSLVETYINTSALTEAGSLVSLYNTKLIGINGSVLFKNDADHDFLGCVFNACEEVDFGGQYPVVRNCIFSNTVGTSSMLWYTDLDIEDCRFINNSYAIRHTISEEVDYISLLFDDNTKDVYYTAASGDLTVNNIGTPRSTASTYTATGSGVVNFVSAVTYTLTDLQANSNIVIQNKDTGAVIDEVENSSTTYNYPYNYGGDIDIIVTVLHIDYDYIRFEDVLENADKSTKIFQQADRWYNNP